MTWTWWMTLAVILAVLLLIGCIPVGVDAAYGEGGIRLAVKIWLFRLQLLPQKPKKKKKPAGQKADQKPRPETPPRKKARLTLNILCTILRGAGRLTRAIIGSLHITKIDVVLGVRGEDPAETARSYGRLNAWLYPALGFLDRFVYLDFEQLRLLPDFGSAQPTVQDRVSFRVSAQAYAIVFTAVRVLYEFWREKVLDVFL